MKDESMIFTLFNPLIFFKQSDNNSFDSLSQVTQGGPIHLLQCLQKFRMTSLLIPMEISVEFVIHLGQILVLLSEGLKVTPHNGQRLKLRKN